MRQMIFRLTLAIVTAAVVVAVPAAATAKQEEDSIEIEGCRNVDASDRSERYMIGSPQTTFMSSVMEGATQGFSGGLSDGPVSNAVRRAVVNPQRQAGAVFNELPRSFRPYCRAYDADRALVASIVENIVSQLGNPVLTSDQQAGIFHAGSLRRGARQVDAFSPAWIDSYILTVEEPTPGRTIVRVFRRVHVARDPGVFNQAISTGRNEKFILTEIGDRLAQ